MAFLDDLGKKFVQVSQTTANKTKELSTIAKLNSVISEEEKKISYTIYQIGKLYLKLHHADYESNFTELIDSMKKSQQVISEAREQIYILKGVSRCDKCGAEVKNNMAFCHSCGNKMNITSNHIKCSSCGALVAKEMKFCTSCGNPMTISNDSAEVDTNKDRSAETTPDFKLCSSCGAKMSYSNTFCAKCGNKL